MKKILLLVSLLGTTALLCAQTVKFGIKGGVNFATEYASYANLSNTTDTHVDFHIGAVADIAFSSISIQPGLLYTGKGMTNARLGYIEVPVNVLYNISAGNNKVFLGGGPYLGYGISSSDGSSFGSGADNIANPDYGLSFLGGLRTKGGMFVSAGYDIGFANLINSSAGVSGLALKNRAGTLSVGYFF